MGAGMTNNQVNNYRYGFLCYSPPSMLSVLYEADRVRTEPSDQETSVYHYSSLRVHLKHTTNLLDQQDKTKRALPKTKTLELKPPFLEFSRTNLLDLVRPEPAPVRPAQPSLSNGKDTLSSQRLKPRRSLQVQNTLEVVQTSRLEKSINVEGLSQINQYTLVESLGAGAFGKVKKATNFKGEVFAVKIANKKKLKKKLLSKTNAYTMLEKEIAIMKKISHQNVVQLFEVIDDPKEDKLYLVMEFMGKGSILSKGFFRSKKNSTNSILEELSTDDRVQKLTEQEVRHYFQDFIKGLEYLNLVHEGVGVIHRDIKPENLLVNEDDVLKIADFGVSDIMEEGGDGRISSQQGTQAYLAPEVFKGSNFEGKPVDIWAGGVTLYQMVYGRLPFQSLKSSELRQQILEENPPFPIPQGFNPAVVQLLRGLLDKNPQLRYNIEVIMSNDWLTDFGKQPLLNEYEEYEEVNEMEIRMALTSLNIQMALKIVVKLLYLAKKARRAIALKKNKK